MANIEYNKLRVIVADDFSNFRATVSAMLHKLDIGQVESVASGREVLQLCQAKRYDLILCDYDLGNGKNGQQVLEELRHKALLPRSSLFILVTADTSRNVVLSAYDCEPDDYMMKPITARALEQRLNRLLRLRAEMMPVYRALDQEDYQLASTLLMAKASGDSRSSTLSQKMLGQLWLQLGEYQQAEKLYSKVLKNRPLDWARLGLARVMIAKKELNTAEDYVAQVTEDNPLYLPAYDLLADIYRDKDDKQALQKTMQNAVSISPMSILRQQRLGSVAEENQDLACAVKAFRRSIKLGELSCHARADDSFGFARTVAAAQEKGLDQDVSLQNEALAALKAAKERFQLSDTQQLQAVALRGRVYAAHGREQEARDALAELDEHVLEGADLELAIDVVAALRNLGDKPRAEQMVNKLLTQYRGNQQALEKLDILLDEPVSDSNRQFVARVNREGIQLYEAQQFDEAIERFQQASRLFPNNTGIQLNMAQALVSKLRAHPEDVVLAAEARQMMEHIGGLVASGHPQFERYARLKALAQSLRH